MFEKDAKEYGKRISKGLPREKNIITKLAIETGISGFQKGAEFGYNKAKEDADKMKSQFLELCNLKDMRIAELEKANEWHDLRKNPKDLPKEYSDVLVYTDDCEHRAVDKCNYHYGKWWVTSQFYYDVEVIAWKEIVLPELKESE